MTREVFFEEFELGSILRLGEQGIEVDLIKILHPVPAPWSRRGTVCDRWSPVS